MKPYFEDRIKESTPSLIIFLHVAEQDAVDAKYLAEQVQKKYADKLNVQRVDTSFNHVVADKYRIESYPTYILFKQGEELMRETGHKTLTELSEMIDRVF